MLLQQRRARANALVACYWLRSILDDGGRQDLTSPSCKGCMPGRSMRGTIALLNAIIHQKHKQGRNFYLRTLESEKFRHGPLTVASVINSRPTTVTVYHTERFYFSVQRDGRDVLSMQLRLDSFSADASVRFPH